MAKQSTTKGGTARIRFILVDAEIPEGDLSEITSAIQNALKPTTTIIQQRLASQTQTALSDATPGDEADLESEAIDLEDEVPAGATPRQRRPRKPTSMKVLEFDLTSATSFEDFASEHMPKNDTERNLVALAWFKEFRPSEVVTPNHVYTCYRAMKWPSGIDDFSSILRNLKAQQLVKSVGRGQYEINHLGIARVEKLGAAS